MRSFLTAVALLLAGVVGTVALTAYVATQTALSPHHSGRLLSSALQQPALRHRLLTAVVPGYQDLPSAVRSELNQVAKDPRLDAAVRHVRIGPDGTVRLTRLRDRLEHELRANGEAPLADLLGTVGGPATVQLPVPVAHQYAAARRSAQLVSRVGAVVAGLLLLFALVVSPNRRRTGQAVGLTILAACAATAVVWWAAPALVRGFSNPVWAQAARVATRSYEHTAFWAVVPVAVGGVAVLLLSFLVPRPRHA